MTTERIGLRLSGMKCQNCEGLNFRKALSAVACQPSTERPNIHRLRASVRSIASVSNTAAANSAQRGRHSSTSSTTKSRGHWM